MKTLLSRRWLLIAVAALIAYAPLAKASNLLINPYALGVAAESNPVLITHVDSDTSASNLDEYTFTGLNFGPAFFGRILVLDISGQDSTSSAFTVSGVTIGGVTATEITSVGGGNRRLTQYYAEVPSGESGNVVVTFSESIISCGIGLRAVRYGSLVTSQTTGGSSLSIDAPANGGLIGAAQSSQSSTFGWSGLDEDYDAVVESSTLSHSGAHRTFEEASASHSVSITPSSDQNSVLIVSSWGPQ